MAKSQATDPVAAHAELIGRVAMAWNNVQYIIFLLFTDFSGLPGTKAEGIFFSLKADRAQREITTEMARVALGPYPVLWTKYWANIKAIEKLAGERNAATHTIWAIEMPSKKISPTPGAPKHKALRSDFTTQFKKLEERLALHFRDLVELQRAFRQLS